MSFAGTPMLEELASLCRGNKSGTLFTTLTDGHQLRTGLLRGRIVHISSFTLRGLAALKALPMRAPKNFRFEAGLVPEHHADLPPTPEILSFLNGALPQRSAKPTSASAVAINPSVFTIVSEELTEYLGPIAEILVDEVRAEAHTLDALLNLLSAKLDSVEDMEHFAKKVRSRLS